ncbi:glutathione S-transferase family protein [Sphingomonas sp. LaA6.9]|uniref:glutathione S-transferase family protein n=1 Tax=Sphingomonas sp. LaA6.9 TaxID=2919914 RepID=UPI001F4FEC27|nr:glutathione S-transferase family protein [Sphingomonas sp. LaA6.9]MCJ8156506.1 glutathione S-transferase family protein [Sphingomonas sp. LaA6.9]
MIILYGCGESFGLPQTSAYVTKTEVQLLMAGLPYEKRAALPDDSPKGQIPFIDDGGTVVADSTFIREWLEARHGIDLDVGLNVAERAQAWAIERMIENQLGWVAAWGRFMIPENFEKGPAHWFDFLPQEDAALCRERMIEAVDGNLHAVGISRHAPNEITWLGARSIAALSTLLGAKRYLMADHPTSVDAIGFAMLAGILTPFFDTPLRDLTLGYPNLVAYVDRMMARYYPDHPWQASLSVAA